MYNEDLSSTSKVNTENVYITFVSEFKNTPHIKTETQSLQSR